MYTNKYVYDNWQSSYLSFLFFQPPPPSSRPPVTEYEIRHNTTGNNLTVTMTEDTEYIVEYTIPGVYLFIVLARNVLGDGNGTSILLTG